MASNRVDVKVAAARAERALERVAEPLCALWLRPEAVAGGRAGVGLATGHPQLGPRLHLRLLATIWSGAAVLDRYGEAMTIAEGLRRRALRGAAAVMAVTGPVVLNPSAQSRSGVVEIVVAGDAPVAGAQVVGRVAAAVMELTGTGASVGNLLGQLAAAGFEPNARSGVPDRRRDRGGPGLRHGPGPPAIPRRGVGARRGLGAGRRAPRPAPSDPGRAVRLAAGGRPRGRRARLRLGRLVARDPDGSPGRGRPGRARQRVDRDDGGSRRWDLVDHTAGGLGKGGPPLAGLGGLVDEGDWGDTYNYSPRNNSSAPTAATADRPEAVSVSVIESGPVRGRAASGAAVPLAGGHRWRRPGRRNGRRGGHRPRSYAPARTSCGSRRRSTTGAGTTGCGSCSRCLTSPNDLRRSARSPWSSGALVAEGGPHEHALATFPSRRFVSAGGLTVLHEGLLEYEVVAGGTALALTVLRATGMLSRPVMAYRDNSAGPALPLEGPQMQGPSTVRYAVHYGSRDRYALADDVWVPLEVVEGAGLVAGPSQGRLLDVTGAQVSALQRVNGQLEVRVFNPRDEETTVAVAGRGGWLVDLQGKPRERFEGTFTLRPFGIATARLDAPRS